MTTGDGAAVAVVAGVAAGGDHVDRHRGGARGAGDVLAPDDRTRGRTAAATPMIDRNAQMRIVGPSSGSVMRALDLPVGGAVDLRRPRTSSWGMPWRPARKRMTAKPMYFHVMIAIRVQIAMLGSASQSCAGAAEADLLEEVRSARRWWPA